MRIIVKILYLIAHAASTLPTSAMQMQGKSLFELSKEHQESAIRLTSKYEVLKRLATPTKIEEMTIKDVLDKRLAEVTKTWEDSLDIANRLLKKEMFVRQVFGEKMPDNATACTQFILGVLKIYARYPLNKDKINLEERFFKFIDTRFLFKLASKTPEYDCLQAIRYVENFLTGSLKPEFKDLKEVFENKIIQFQRLSRIRMALCCNLNAEFSDFFTACNTDYEQVLDNIQNDATDWSNPIDLEKIFLLSMFDYKTNSNNNLSANDFKKLKPLILTMYRSSRYPTEDSINKALSRQISSEEFKTIQGLYEQIRRQLQKRDAILLRNADRTRNTAFKTIFSNINIHQSLRRNNRSRSNSRELTKSDNLELQKRPYISNNAQTYDDNIVQSNVKPLQQFGDEYVRMPYVPKPVSNTHTFEVVQETYSCKYSYTQLQDMLLQPTPYDTEHNIPQDISNAQYVARQPIAEKPTYKPYVPQPFLGFL